MAEFTGERVIPGRVEPDLWNEHRSRYAFAATYARGRRVLDAGCGAGYGSAALAETAARVTGIDVAPEAVKYARAHYSLPNLDYIQASCTAIPLRDASFHLIVAFEVIEHLRDWAALLEESCRLLAPGGLFLVSTPNILYYARTREQAGPNPFHEHEFELHEFEAELSKYFASVRIFTQNHSESVAFQPLSGSLEMRAEAAHGAGDPDAAHFFLALCGQSDLPPPVSYVYLPSVANALEERDEHIRKLKEELAQKNEWLQEAIREHAKLLNDHQGLMKINRKLNSELEQANYWAEKLNVDLKAASERAFELQEELAREQEAATLAVSGYEAKIAELESDNEAKTNWARETERRLTRELWDKCDELQHCVEVLHNVEAELEARTAWAQQVDQERHQLHNELTRRMAQLRMTKTSRWVRLGRAVRIGPNLQDI